jgi:hypothetical protein
MLNFKTKTGSRNRVRIPVAGTRFTKAIKPGDRVEVGYDLITDSIRVQVNPKGNYKVEKDGAVRFPAHKFNLKPKNIFISSESIGKDVNLVNLESATF